MKEEEKRTKREKEGNNVRQANKTYKNKQFTSITCTYINDDDDRGNSRNGFQKTDNFQKNKFQKHVNFTKIHKQTYIYYINIDTYL